MPGTGGFGGNIPPRKTTEQKGGRCFHVSRLVSYKLLRGKSKKMRIVAVNLCSFEPSQTAICECHVMMDDFQLEKRS